MLFFDNDQLDKKWASIENKIEEFGEEFSQGLEEKENEKIILWQDFYQIMELIWIPIIHPIEDFEEEDKKFVNELSVNESKMYHLGFRDACELRERHFFEAFDWGLLNGDKNEWRDFLLEVVERNSNRYHEWLEKNLNIN